jgi:anti-sigma regulatory factor (Ser/Thr protein kinase)
MATDSCIEVPAFPTGWITSARPQREVVPADFRPKPTAQKGMADALMQTEMTSTPKAITFERDYAGSVSEAQRVRVDLARVATECPASEELILLASELATNAILHSRSGDPDRMFTVRATLYLGEYAWVEVIDQGGPWEPRGLMTSAVGVLASSARSPEMGTGGSTATPHAVWHGSGSTGTHHERGR